MVLTDAPLTLQLEVNSWTRAYGKQFLAADARGLFAFIFVDLGADFVVNDPNGEQCKEVSCFSLIVFLEDRNVKDVKDEGKEGCKDIRVSDIRIFSYLLSIYIVVLF